MLCGATQLSSTTMMFVGYENSSTAPPHLISTVCHMMETFATDGKRMVILCNYFVMFHTMTSYKMIY
jgi:hypothetical protein